MLFDHDDPFDKLFSGGTPQEKFYEIMYVANRHLVEQEVHKMVKRLVALEALMDERPDLEKEIRSYLLFNESDVEHHANNIYLEMTASIVSNNE